MKKISIYLVVLGIIGCTGAVTTGRPTPVSCTISGNTITCPDGTTVTVHDGLQGPIGPVGGTGLPGPQGEPGTNGIDATPVMVVPFCSGSTVYPINFTEVGLCINSKLFGVYWDSHNSWLTEIPSGQYRSTSTTNPCNFEVKPNCEVI